MHTSNGSRIFVRSRSMRWIAHLAQRAVLARMTPAIRLVGLDWSAEESKRGVAVIDVSADATMGIELSCCSARRRALEVVANAVSTASTPILIAIDAPLGWPVGLSQALARHAAGEGLEVDADGMFARETDRFVRDALKKRPLEVGANLIARTAHSANQFVRELRRTISADVPLLWSPDELMTIGIIEVYPAATKRGTELRSPAIALGLQATTTFTNQHVEDALWCVVAGLHFARGQCEPPPDLATSKREGWIWFRRSSNKKA